MKRTIVNPAQLDLESRGRRDYFVALEHDSIWGDHLIPLTVIVGPEARHGQGLVAFGSNHGNEYEGPMVLKHLLSEIDTEAVRGRIILVPVLNPAAFRAGTRDSTLDDGVNLNRAFVEGAGATPALGRITHRIARFVREAIWPHVHVVIDLHAGGEVARFAPATSFHPIDDPEQGRHIESAARWFGTPVVIVYQNETPGLLPSEAEALGKITIGSELGWGAAAQHLGIRWGRQGVIAAAIHSGQLKGSIAPIDHHRDNSQVKAAMVARECFTTSPVSGHYEPLMACGVRVKVGTVVGLVHDFERIDATPWEVRAGVDGVVIAQAWGARVRQGQHVLVTGIIVPWLD
ncbi:putative deacylase [Mesorhizobium robiniae]|uniref:Deacylase n=1 Tax=Mesorhizobium robiniae TaxID=559315 RepID=A0ABV2GFX4_9HYPH